ncbi:hypothetical protein SRHO_G00081510 [Serrasalmus rhombeus]
MNDALVRGCEQDVGNKTTIRLFYPESASSYPAIHNDPDSLMVLVPFKQQDLRWLKEILYNEKRVRTGFLEATSTDLAWPNQSAPYPGSLLSPFHCKQAARDAIRTKEEAGDVTNHLASALKETFIIEHS